MIDVDLAAKLITAIARDNTFKRGRKSRMCAWKVMFGVYVSARYKHPSYVIAGVHWKLHYNVEHAGYRASHSNGHVLPSPNLYQAKHAPKEQRFHVKFDKFEGDEDIFKKEFTLLKMFESQWDEASAWNHDPGI